MSKGWNKGLTKETNDSVRRISETMRLKGIDNFRTWRLQAKRSGFIKSKYEPLKKNGDTAELIGVVLGDGHICKHARCESLRITSNSNNKGFINRYADLVERVFGKKPTIAKVKTKNAVTITIYEKNISQRLGVPSGNRATVEYKLPLWIQKVQKNKIRFLRGLYEAEGSECHHAPTSTHKLFFSNRNKSLLVLVENMVSELGFKTNTYQYNVQVSRGKHVQDLVNLLEFRHYGM